MSMGLAWDQVGGRMASRRIARFLRQGGELAAEIDQAVDGENADTTAIGKNCQAVARKRLLPPKRLGRGEELVEIEHAQQSGPAEGRIIDRIGAGERAGMGRGGLRPLRMPSGLDHHHGLHARGGTGRRHEFLRVVDGLDVEQDRARAAVGGEEVETVAEIDVDLVAERNDGRKAHMPLRCPFHEARRHRARLGDERQIARLGAAGREARIHFGPRRHDADAVRADDAQSMRAAPRA